MIVRVSNIYIFRYRIIRDFECDYVLTSKIMSLLKLVEIYTYYSEKFNKYIYIYKCDIPFRILGCDKWYQSRSLYHRDGGTNLIGVDESLRGDVCNILGESHISMTRSKIPGRPEEDVRSLSGGVCNNPSHMDKNYIFDK